MVFKNADIIPVIGDIVNSMRASGSYTSVYDGTNTLITADNTFNKYDFVTIGGIDRLIIEATTTTFTVKDDMTGESTYKAAAPYYAYGHIQEIAKALMDKDNSTQFESFKKFPLIMLLLDVTRKPNKTLQTFDYDNVNIVIVNSTKPDYMAADRKENNFDPILHPLYEDFIKELSRSRLLNNSNSIPFISHSATDRYFWGTELNKNSTKNIVNDFLDAVDIKELNIKVNQQNC